MKLPVIASLVPKSESLPLVEIRRVTPSFVDEGDEVTFSLYFFQPVAGMSFEMYAANKGSRNENYDTEYHDMVDAAIAGRGLIKDVVNANRCKLTLTDDFDGRPIFFSRTVVEDTKTEGLLQADVILAEEDGCKFKGVVSMWMRDTSTTLPGASTIRMLHDGKSFESEETQITIFTEYMIPGSQMRFYCVNDGSDPSNWEDNFQTTMQQACADANCTWEKGAFPNDGHITFTADYDDNHPVVITRRIKQDYLTEGVQQVDFILSDIDDVFIVYGNAASIFIQDSSQTPEFIGWKVELSKNQVTHGEGVLLTIFDSDSLVFEGSVQIEDSNNDAFFVNSLATDISAAVAATSGVTFDESTMTLSVTSDWDRELFVSRQCKPTITATKYTVRLKNASGQSKVKIADEALFFEQPALHSFPPYLSGVNISGAEFSSSAMPGIDGQNYFWQKPEMVDYFAAKGYKWFRLPFRWPRLQRTLFGDFDATEEAKLDNMVDYITNTLGHYCLLDPHDYGKYISDSGSNVIGIKDGNTPPEAFYDFWARLADKFKDNPKVQFGLMNEPLGNTPFDWRDYAKGAINAIRARTDAVNLVTVPGTFYTGAHNWLSFNDTAFRNFKDPADNMIIEVHQYLNHGSSGTSGSCVIDSHQRFIDFTNWCKEYGFQAMLGEFGVSDPNAEVECATEIPLSMQYMQDNQDVWRGYTLWGAGAQWSRTYIYRLNPLNNDYDAGVDSPQLDFAEQFILNNF
ncbi:glycoside hydrolase family 5 protein [Alteromonas sp.]|uniref:glycoside hydrolase family 5 protein n=1 Tax=Alteromonas sp. TaxID=232 RepID=UPI00257D87A3|nr:glycoside hydrolase family 5 protein [Alteromonas sp.]NQY17776.1 cellulase family glycosylhydrolase [Alteromonas sp.]